MTMTTLMKPDDAATGAGNMRSERSQQGIRVITSRVDDRCNVTLPVDPPDALCFVEPMFPSIVKCW